MRGDMRQSKRYEVRETIDGEWMITFDGIQWGKGPRDLSGCSSQTWPTRQEAINAVESEPRKELK